MNLPFKIGISPKLKIRGLIATENIKRHQVIERCPLILIKVKQEEILEKSNFRHYYFLYSKKFHAIVLGYLSLVNHSFKPNCELVYDYRNKTINLRAIKNIVKGDELTYKYMEKNEVTENQELLNFNKTIES